MKISVIIPVYNEEKLILKCLESLGEQSSSDFEVIVVDDGSTDQTVKLIEDFQITNYPALPAGGKSRITLLHQKHKGPGAGRNYGALKAKGDILVFVDADMTFAHDFIKKLTLPIIKDQNKPAGRRGTFSKDEYVSNWDNLWVRCWNINEGWEEKRRHPRDYPDKQKVFRAILKSEFDKVGGFDVNRGYNDDWSLSEKLGYEAEIVRDAVFYHKNPDTLKEVFVQSKWVSKREYKFGLFGSVLALVRASLPFSILIGIYKSIINCSVRFLIFKIISDFGLFIGIVEMLIFKRVSK